MEPFAYHDKGIMAMIGHNAAIAEMGEHRHELQGAVGYAAWIGVHAYLMGVSRQRRDAFISWAWDEFGKSRVLDTSDEARLHWGGGDGWLSATTSSSSAPAPGAARSRTRSPPPARRSCCSSEATSCRGSERTGTRGQTSSTAATSRRTRGTTRTASRFQPQVHYYVGGATKLYGAALYRLRPQDFGELKHVDGVSPAWPLTYDDFEPYYTKAEWLYQVHGNHGEDPIEGHWSKQYPWPAVSHEPRIQQLSDDLAAAGYHPFHAPCGDPARRGRPDRSTCIRCTWCDGYPCLVHAKSDAEVMAVRPAIGLRQRRRSW